MKIKRSIFIIGILLILNTNSYAEEQYKKFGTGTVVFNEQNLAINVEIASTKMQRTIGLMFREQLEANSGMLFDFKTDTVQRIWMKNTLIPLDAVFISAEGKIVSLIKGMPPCAQDSCETYNSMGPVRYLLELNAGVIDRQKIKVGQILLFFL